MNRTDKRISRSLSLQIYYAWVMSEIHPKEILEYVKDLLLDHEINDNFYMNGSIINNKELILSDDIIDYSYKLLEETINKCDAIDNYIIVVIVSIELKKKLKVQMIDINMN